MRLLIVEDEVGLVTALRRGLSRDGYAVDTASTLSDAQDKLIVTPYDLVILDLSLPDGDGLSLCLAIRERRLANVTTDTRILMLTARSNLTERVRGLDSGADDYLTKPFALSELLARVRALLRRDVAGGTARLQVGDVVLDRSRHEVTLGGAEVNLTLKEFGALEYLMSHAERVVSAEELLEHVWDENADPFTETVRVTVGTLRRKLSSIDDRSPIETVIGRGYRLKGER